MVQKAVQEAGRYVMRGRFEVAFLGLVNTGIFIHQDIVYVALFCCVVAMLYLWDGLVIYARLKTGVYGDCDFEEEEIAKYWCRKFGVDV